jgi:glycosyltransferase involved in cell wall biosynthesis
VANTAPGLRDSVVEGETGLLYKENDAQSLSESIEKLLDDDSMRLHFSKQGRLWAEKFSWDASAEKVERWLRKIVHEKRS